ncbi:1-acyl-sn-glycerol-3-phosphate acyltransferase [Herbaspirillum seropedicae]|uniref:1-acyl-sn-glycerol-3-phosphate O-acyltransferase protein n=1 Tax=Herbaspirillum seropedicae (strain SmR1) TaxID=757424 RepID=D8IR54_HERSS|nr:lysophospholipid acyltransferase family protein [Herbaspirillum seropedicae]ADJ65180.1 1-acyl-sn-glycerol-3-phosphate O-acyltransferase protein [Herbaspirillum seropedicae SmR1]AKN67040.1 acyltransferase [Herbaspirillum seropedicae]AON56077.1 1-acyl-sn-glycerol-3-phosphate acyltransferase [Herbaspirillum seropedicae]NQE30359.1 acyltransferase [Herbaspirillum seropedicae]QDD66012.1 1-acyl-sn-glycerol-3-phosphate acyltransferase [Herbaspirillum seropedicae]
MLDRVFALIDRGWRILATGMCFALFGLGGLLLRLVVFPILQLLVRDAQQRVLWARHIIRLAFRAFVELMRICGVIRYEISGLERLNRNGQLILANHPTLIDTVLLMAFVRHADCIVKNALWRNPFTRGPIRAAGYISNDQGPDLIEDCIRSIRSGGNLIIFPEGTRTPTDGQISLKRGAANVAVRCGCPITPVRIRCTPVTLSKGEKWWQVPARRAHFRLQIGDDLHLDHIIGAGQPHPADNPTLAARQLTTYLQQYFMKEN